MKESDHYAVQRLDQGIPAQDCALPKPPAWLRDEPEIVAILENFLNKLDKTPASERKRMPSYKLSRKQLPRLYRHDELADRTWVLLCGLDGTIFTIRRNPRRSQYDAEYVDATLTLLVQGEEICRAWLSRPVQQRYAEAWSEAVDCYAQVFNDQGVSLRARPIRLAGKSAQAVVGAFASMTKYTHANLTLRQLSAKCFWGHSKVLDFREELVQQTFPALQIVQRPILVQVRLPQTYSAILFIENLDTYVQALAAQCDEFNDMVLVYAAGFRNSALRIRQPAGVSLHYHASTNHAIRAQFESWWFGSDALPVSVWFWGDLDFSGMAILHALRQRFSTLQAWPIGYARLLQALQDGFGHVAEVADKAEQRDPGQTGCEYTDTVLLPAIRQYQQFVDQEFA